MAAPLTQEQALSILSIFGGQYPFNDISGFLLALENLGIIDPSAVEVYSTSSDAPAEAVVAGAAGPSGQDAASAPAAAITTEPAPVVESAPAPDASPAA